MGLGRALLPGLLHAGPGRAMPPRILGGSWVPLRVCEATGVVPLPPSRWTAETTALGRRILTMSRHGGCHRTGMSGFHLRGGGGQKSPPKLWGGSGKGLN